MASRLDVNTMASTDMQPVSPSPLLTSSMLMHKLQREALLETSVPKSDQFQNPSSRPGARTPRSGNTPLHSPRSLSPLRRTHDDDPVDFQEAILRAQKTFPQIEQPPETDGTALHVEKHQHRQERNLSHQHRHHRHRSPTEEHEMPTDVAVMEKTKPSRRKRSSNSSVVANDIPVAVEDGLKHHAEGKSSRSSSRRTKSEIPQDQLPDTDLAMEESNVRLTKRSHARVHASQNKNKIAENVSTLDIAPVSMDANIRRSHGAVHISQSQTMQHQQIRHDHHQTQLHEMSILKAYGNVAQFFPSASSPPPSRKASREATVAMNTDWLEHLEDIIMWRHVPRSTFLFGLGFFSIMSTSLIQESQFSVVSAAAYLSLFYLAITYIKCTFLHRSTTVSTFTITENDALRLIRLFLPPINAMLSKTGDFFSGRPSMTLKVSAFLWFLAQFGSRMHLWTLMRIAYFALFTIPRCYLSYSEQIERQGKLILQRVRTTWSACKYKKAVLVGVFIMAWNLSSMSTRVFGAFIALVAIRAYRHVITGELVSNSSSVNHQ